MKITISAFNSIRGLHPARLHGLSRVKKNIEQYYCDKMTTRGLCPQECEQCILVLQGIITNIQTIKPNSPYGFLTWSLKNEVANAADKVSSEKKPGAPRNALGEVQDSDPFDALEAMFNGG